MTTESVSIVFTDVVGSTELLSRLGDEAAEALRRRHMAQLREVIATHGGREVKSLGDGLMVAFAVPSSALAATVDMQRAVHRQNADAGEKLAIRIGVATGECDVDGLDLHGTTVVEAARLCALADGGQILVTDVVRALTGSRGNHRFDGLGPAELKGIARPVVVHELAWIPTDDVDGGDPRPAERRAVTADERGLFAAELRRRRETASLTQEELAERAGLSAKAIGALERGERRRPHPNTVRALAEALGLDDAGRTALTTAARGPQPPDPSAPPQPSTSVSSKPRIPAPPTATVGRDREQTDILSMLTGETVRLVTLTGPGGVGKTRLAWDVALELGELGLAPVPVELAPVRGSDLVMPTIARALGVRVGSEDLLEVVASVIEDDRRILVLDNFEHVLDAAPDIASLLARCAHLRVLATSRAPLRIRAEQEYPIHPLALPVTDDEGAVVASPAGRLFVNRLRAVDAATSLDARALASIGAICRRLDGLPLAIELAAAHARYVRPAQLLDRLDRALGDARVRDLPARQQTMQATLDWSLDLCTEDEQRLLGAVSVFAGGFDLEAVVAVAGTTVGDPPGALAGLVEQSLVVADATTDGSARYRLLEPVRMHAASRLSASEAEDVAARHAAHFASLTADARSGLWGLAQAEWLELLTREHANVAAALTWFVERDDLAGASAVLADVWMYWAVRGHAGEGLRWVERVTGDRGFAQLDPGTRAVGLVSSAGLRLATGDTATVIQHADIAARLAGETGDEQLRCDALLLFSLAALFEADLEQSAVVLGELEGLMTSSAEGWIRAHALTARGQLLIMQGDLASAGRVLADAETLARHEAGPFTVAWVLNVAAMVAVLEGADDDLVLERLTEAATISAEVETTWTLVYTLPGLAGLALRRGQTELAATLFAAAATVIERSMVTLSFNPDAEAAAAHLELVRRRLDADTFERAWIRGRELDPRDVIALVGSLSGPPART